jgi:hypothetical protein
MNVELTKERKSLITQKLIPLARLTVGDQPASFDVVIRKVSKSWLGVRYCVSVRMSTETNKYYAIASEPYIEKAVSAVRSDLRKSISKRYKAVEFSTERKQRFVRERQYLQMFA